MLETIFVLKFQFADSLTKINQLIKIKIIERHFLLNHCGSLNIDTVISSKMQIVSENGFYEFQIFEE